MQNANRVKMENKTMILSGLAMITKNNQYMTFCKETWKEGLDTESYLSQKSHKGVRLKSYRHKLE